MALVPTYLGWVDEYWPPESAASPDSALASVGNGFTLKGKVADINHHKNVVEVRRQKQQGYLKGKKTLDIVAKYAPITLEILAIHKGDKTLSLNQFRSEIQSFLSQFAKDTNHDSAVEPMEYLFKSTKAVVVLCKTTAIAELAAKTENKQYNTQEEVLIKGDTVTVQTLGPSLLCPYDIQVDDRVERTGAIGSMKGETHLYGRGAVQIDSTSAGNLGFHDKVMQVNSRIAANMEQSGQAGRSEEVDDDEWDD